MIKANDNIIIDDKTKIKKVEELTTIFEDMLRILGFDQNGDQNLVNTPKRMAKMYVNELFGGCYSKEPDVTVFDNSKKSNSMIHIGPIRINSVCSHHFLPFTGVCHVAYIPGQRIVGVSKIPRIVHYFAKRPQIQEELTEQISQYFLDKIQPIGVGVYVKAMHSCMRVRGVEEPTANMITTSLDGAFRDNVTTKNEFLTYIANGGE